MNDLPEPPILTLDQDWAPDFLMKYAADILTKKNIKATWFITNDSPILKNLKENPLFEIGLHPNFYSDSTQGSNFDLVLQNLKKLVPEAKSARTHSLLQSNHLLLQFQRYGLENDSSIILHKTKKIIPHYSKFFKLYRFPFFWEDDFEMAENSDWNIEERTFQEEGLKIFNFHPIHIYLNSKIVKKYEIIKNEFGLLNLNENNIQQFINKDDSGTGTFFEQITDWLSNEQTYQIHELKKIYKEFF